MKLIFVYNAEAGLVQGLLDSIHKTLSPATYACDLCAITYGLTSMRPEWRDWLKRSGIEATFHHRKDFHEAWPAVDVALPCILSHAGPTPELLVSADDMKDLKTVGELIAFLEARMASH